MDLLILKTKCGTWHLKVYSAILALLQNQDFAVTNLQVQDKTEEASAEGKTLSQDRMLVIKFKVDNRNTTIIEAA